MILGSHIKNNPLSQDLQLLLIRCKCNFPGSSDGKECACNAGDQGLIPGLGDPLEKGMATHSSILAWRIPRTEESGGLQSKGLQESDMTQTTTNTSLYKLM